MDSVKQAYDEWSEQYDTVENKTRDLEGLALREVLGDTDFNSVLEIGCGTGKNTEWFVDTGAGVTGVDLSAKMLDVARQKLSTKNATFHIADIRNPWDFVNSEYDLVSFSLVLEHIEELGAILQKAWASLKSGGHVYIGELHPFKQYAGSKARFSTAAGTQVVTCYTHHLSDFLKPALKMGFQLKDVREYFDADGDGSPPRILALLMVKV